jgi:DNA-3-methyladenine glycosylase I
VTGVVVGSDGRPRCPWGLSTPDYLAYHDHEWGQPIHDDNGIYERLTLEAFQSGLSWLTILRKRANFRAAFAAFDIETVASFDETDRARLLVDAGIVRNRAKIDAALANAKAAAALDDGLAVLVWSFTPDSPRVPVELGDVPAHTAESKALAKELKRRDFVFVGPTTAYAAMQAAGLVNDHLRDCWVRDPAARAPLRKEVAT